MIALAPLRLSITSGWPSTVSTSFAMMRALMSDAAPPSPGTRTHDVQIAARIAPDPVARAKCRIAPMCKALAVEREHAHHAGVVLDDVHDVLVVHVEDCRADQLRRPYREQPPVL